MADDGSPSVDDTGLTEKAMNESLWVSPSAEATVNRDTTKPGNGQTLFEKEAARETSLRAELATVRKVNEAIEGMVESLKKAQANMKMVNSTVSSASSLLNTWTRILSQTEHNQRLILNPAWQGASQDIADMEREAIQKQRATERREVEEQLRREERSRKAEEDERRKTEAAAAPKTRARGTNRGRVRGIGRTTSTGSVNTARGGSRNNSTQPGGRSTPSNPRRTTGGFGRGYGGGRGRGIRD